MGRFSLISCRRKVRYGHKATAERALAHMAKRGVTGMEAYGCWICLGWHIGHPHNAKSSVSFAQRQPPAHL